MRSSDGTEPFSHTSQSDCPAFDIFPAGHGAHAAADWVRTVPIGQAVHAEPSPEATFPAGQDSHAD